MSRSAWLVSILVALTGFRTLAADPLPEIVTIEEESVRARFAMPSGYCLHADSLVAEVQREMPESVVILAAGTCANFKRSILIAMLREHATPAGRPTKAAYLRDCFKQFPDKKDQAALDQLLESFNENGHALLGDAVKPLGLLRATREAVFGGKLFGLSYGSVKALQIQVTACTAPAGLPVQWQFSEVVPLPLGADEYNGILRSLLDIAVRQVDATAKMND